MRASCVPLSRRTRNHLGSMYFGALCTGADAAAALLGFQAARGGAGGRISVIFKDVRAEFLKRAEADVHFACEQGREIRGADREARTRPASARTCPCASSRPCRSRFGAEPVARFKLTLSVKRRG